MAEQDQQIGRLAMRREGAWWVAYYAMPDTMDGAILLGQIAMRFVEGGDLQQRRKDAFMQLMRDSVADLFEERFGVRPTWPKGPQAAPEHERSGNA